MMSAFIVYLIKLPSSNASSRDKQHLIVMLECVLNVYRYGQCIYIYIYAYCRIEYQLTLSVALVSYRVSRESSDIVLRYVLFSEKHSPLKYISEKFSSQIIYIREDTHSKMKYKYLKFHYTHFSYVLDFYSLT